MKLLLTSGGITNPSIHTALTELLGKPIAASSAIFIPTAMYSYPRHAAMAWRAFGGKVQSPLCELGWKSLDVLELTALPTINAKDWMPMVEEADALLVWGGDPVYLAYWMRQSGLGELLRSLRGELVYVGVSAGSMAASSLFAESYTGTPSGHHDALSAEAFAFATAEGEATGRLVTARGVGLVDFALIPHLDGEGHPDASLANAERWAARIPAPVYAIDDQTAIAVTDGDIRVVSEGHWRRFSAGIGDDPAAMRRRIS